MNGNSTCQVLTGWIHYLHRESFNETFAERLIFRNGDISWPSSSPDLSPCDFFFWGSKVYQAKPYTIVELKEAMQREIAAIPFAMLTNVMRNVNEGLQGCINVEGRYLPIIIFHN